MRCINYTREDVAVRVRDLTGGAAVDRVIEVDLAANGAKVPELAMRANATVVVYGAGGPPVVPFGPAIVKNLTYRFFIVYNLDAPDRERAVGLLTSLLERDALRHHVAERLPLAQIARARTRRSSRGAWSATWC